MEPPSASWTREPARSMTGSGWPVLRLTGMRAPDTATTGAPVVAEAAAESVSVADSSSRAYAQAIAAVQAAYGYSPVVPVNGLDRAICLVTATRHRGASGIASMTAWRYTSRRLARSAKIASLSQVEIRRASSGCVPSNPRAADM